MKEALIDERGLIAQVSPLGSGMVATPPSQLVPCPEDCEAYTWTWDGETFSPPPGPTFEEARATATHQIERDRYAACLQPVQAHGRTWQADKRSQELLGSAITLAANGLPLPPAWRDIDNNNMPITALADLLIIAGAIAAQTQAAYTTSWSRKAALEAPVTVPDVDAV